MEDFISYLYFLQVKLPEGSTGGHLNFFIFYRQIHVHHAVLFPSPDVRQQRNEPSFVCFPWRPIQERI